MACSRRIRSKFMQRRFARRSLLKVALREMSRMRSKASAMFSRIAPRKARMIADLVRGRDAAEAIQLLQFTTKSGAPVLKKVIESAVANARNDGADVDVLFVSKAAVDKGPNKFNRRW